jgi:polyhydroxyalkanoate synthesis regulator phasin
MSGVGVGGVCKGKDGESCQKGADCLSGVCNIIDQCGPVVCSNGTKQCDELGCFIPSTRKYGEAYKCSWECKSGFGTNGICKRSFGELCVIIIILIFVLGVGIFFAWLAFKRFKTKKAEQEAGEIKIGIIRGAREEGKKIREDIVREAEEEFKNTKVKINKINLELKSKKNELAVLEEEKGSLVSKREDIQQLRLQISKLSNRLKRDNEDLAIHKKQWNEERIKPYKNPQGYEVIINEEGYEVFANNHNRLFHIWWYRKNRGAITPGYQIHHKDFNKRNNDVDNLVEVTPGQHEKLHKDQKY